MKSKLFKTAISNRFQVRFLYSLNEIIIEPYYLSRNSNGKKVVYGRISRTNEVKVFEFDKMYNIRVLDWKRFSPVIPILPSLN